MLRISTVTCDQAFFLGGGGVVRKSADGKKGNEDRLIAGYQYCGHYDHHSGHHYA